MKPDAAAGNCWRQIHLCTRLALRPWLKATPATEAPGRARSSTNWALKDLGYQPVTMGRFCMTIYDEQSSAGAKYKGTRQGTSPNYTGTYGLSGQLSQEPQQGLPCMESQYCRSASSQSRNAKASSVACFAWS